MRISTLVTAAIERTRTLPGSLRYLVTMGLVVVALLARQAAEPLLPPGHPFMTLFVAIFLAGALFDHGCGLFAVVLSAVLAAIYLLPPAAVFSVGDPGHLVALGLFVGIGAAMTFVIESLHRALAGERDANRNLARSECSRRLLLHEFRHRTRNDLGSLVGLLHLRARVAGSEAVREGLREAAQHALALARVHTRLAAADIENAAIIDTRGFVLGLCRDIEAAGPGEGLRPVALVAEAEAHAIDSERAVQLGLVLNETVTNALKYAFPEGRAGRVTVRFLREGGQYVLSVVDDGIGAPPEDDMDASAPRDWRRSGLGTRLLQSLAAQLRGSFTRLPAPACNGTVTELRFPVETPGRARNGRRPAGMGQRE